ncbi:hypothetical protein Bca101_061114 [Brassica carinata]
MFSEYCRSSDLLISPGSLSFAGDLGGLSCQAVEGFEQARSLSLTLALLFPKPTFSLGLTQEEHHNLNEFEAVINYENESITHVVGDVQIDKQEQLLALQKRKRQKLPLDDLWGSMSVTKKFLKKAREALVASYHTGENFD